jgi:hypothetical protein
MDEWRQGSGDGIQEGQVDGLELQLMERGEALGLNRPNLSHVTYRHAPVLFEAF